MTFRRADETVALDDRGLLYGDGLFETIRFDRGRAALWSLHWRRLARDLARIAIPVPAEEAVAHWCRQALGAPRASGVVRVTVTRGRGPRGYAPPPEPAPTHVVQAGAVPVDESRALVTISCRTPASANRALAGLKHLGRLDQVLAAAEVRGAGADEGLLATDDGELVEGVSGNWILRIGGAWVTPAVERAGVAGVFRQWLLDAGLVSARRIERDELAAATAAMVVNAVRGMRPVARLDDRELDVAATRRLMDEAGSPWPAAR